MAKSKSKTPVAPKTAKHAKGKKAKNAAAAIDNAMVDGESPPASARSARAARRRVSAGNEDDDAGEDVAHGDDRCGVLCPSRSGSRPP